MMMMMKPAVGGGGGEGGKRRGIGRGFEKMPYHRAKMWGQI